MFRAPSSFPAGSAGLASVSPQAVEGMKLVHSSFTQPAADQAYNSCALMNIGLPVPGFNVPGVACGGVFAGGCGAVATGSCACGVGGARGCNPRGPPYGGAGPESKLVVVNVRRQNGGAELANLAALNAHKIASVMSYATQAGVVEPAVALQKNTGHPVVSHVAYSNLGNSHYDGLWFNDLGLNMSVPFAVANTVAAAATAPTIAAGAAAQCSAAAVPVPDQTAWGPALFPYTAPSAVESQGVLPGGLESVIMQTSGVDTGGIGGYGPAALMPYNVSQRAFGSPSQAAPPVAKTEFSNRGAPFVQPVPGISAAASSRSYPPLQRSLF